MKKIMILAAIAAAAISCSKTFEVNEAIGESPIGFNTWNDVLTKARTNGTGTSSFANNEMFGVYGTKLVSATPYEVFNGAAIKATVSESVSWNYNDPSDIKYWDPAATSYTFYAALPSSMVTAYNSLTADQKTDIGGAYSANGKFYGSFTFNDPTAITNDVMIASEKTVTSGSFKQEVQLAFNHIASCVSLVAKKDAALSGATVKVTGVKFKNVKKSGNFHVTAYSTTPSVTWSNQSGFIETEASSQIYNVNIGGDKTITAYSTYQEGHGVDATTGDPNAIFGGLVFLPQTFTDGTEQMLISYTIKVGDEPANVYTDVPVDLYDFMSSDSNNNSAGSNVSSWDFGKHYTYTITIGANAIQFSASVNAWTASSAYYYLVD